MITLNTPISLRAMRFYPVVLGFMGHALESVMAFFDGTHFYAQGNKLTNGDTLLGISAEYAKWGEVVLSPSEPTPSLDEAVDSYIAINSDTQFDADLGLFPFLHHPDLSNPDVVYLYQALEILRYGATTSNRTSFATHYINSTRAVFDVRLGVPILTTKSVGAQNVLKEMRWMLSGDSNNNTLRKTGCTIWDEWATENGELGPVYGAMWRHWPDRRFLSRDTPSIGDRIKRMKERGFIIENESEAGVSLFREIDQVKNVINKLKHRPSDRRIMFTGLNPSYTPYDDLSPVDNAKEGQQALPPCHLLYHFLPMPMSLSERLAYYQASLGDNPLPIPELIKITEQQLDALHKVPKYFLDLTMYQRSGDHFLGIPYNRTACYIIMAFFAAHANMVPRYFTHDVGNAHLYVNHVEQITYQMMQPIGPRCTGTLHYTSLDDIENLEFKLHGYKKGPVIKGEVAI